MLAHSKHPRSWPYFVTPAMVLSLRELHHPGPRPSPSRGALRSPLGGRDRGWACHSGPARGARHENRAMSPGRGAHRRPRNMNSANYRMTDQEHATVLAALRFYQHQGLADDPGLRPDGIHDIATGGGNTGFVASLNGRGIDMLCEQLNAGGEDDADPLPQASASIRQALELAARRAERELGRWPAAEVDNTEHRALRTALGQFQAALDQLTGGAS